MVPETAGAGAPTFDLATPRRVHIVAVGGAAMSAIAVILARMGHEVSGSDAQASPVLDRLRAAGIRVEVGHRADHLGDAELVAISAAVPPTNPEVTAARERGVPVLRRAEVMAAVAARRRTVAVAGTHGKTTTSAMLALVLADAGVHPSYLVGGDMNELGPGVAWDDDGDLMVVEADESDGTFVALGAEAALVTNVEADHLEFYGGEQGLRAAFDRFVAAAPGPRVVCADDRGAAVLAERHGGATYGTADTATYRMTDLDLRGDGSRFAVVRAGDRVAHVALRVPGLHNARNAAGALAMAVELGIPAATAASALGRFTGVGRRFEPRGEAAGVTFVDSYDHLPTEVAAVLAAARLGAWNRIVCVFQPHRYSRVAALWRAFADAFVDADVLVVTDVYPAFEAPRPGVTGKLIVHAVLDAHPWKRVAYLPRLPDVAAFLARELRPGDLCLTLGAGDLTTVPDGVQAALAART